MVRGGRPMNARGGPLQPDSRPPASRYVVGIGESLLDCFESRTSVGGAPLNFAIHAQQLLGPTGYPAAIASRTGADAAAGSILDSLRRFGVSDHWLQRDPGRLTGRVDVRLNDAGDAEYLIQADSAWDALEWTDELDVLAQSCRAVCFGCLGQRATPARTTIQAFLDAAPHAIRIFDVNLRNPWPTAQLLRDSFRRCTVAKMNKAELRIVCSRLELTESDSEENCARELRYAFGLDTVVVTRGARGTVAFGERGRFEGAPAFYPPAADADSVGAGDACTAGIVAGMLLGLPLQDTLSLANRAGAFVASRAGATPAFPDDLVAPAPHAR